MLFALVIFSADAFAAEGVPLAEAPPGGAEGTKYFHEQAKLYELKLAGDETPLKLIDAPLLNWTNPARTNENGILVVWLHDGRPEALATMFTYQVQDRVYEKHEFVSLSTVPLVATFAGHRTWTPQKAGLKFNKLTELAPPAKNARLRNLQMRRIARQFTGTITNGPDDYTELRQLPQPLYQYEKTTGDLLGGAIFSLNVGTDPEVLIVVEARGTQTSAQWQYSLARLHYHELVVERNRKQVWSAPQDFELGKDVTGQTKYMNDTYFTFYPQTVLNGASSKP